MVEKQAQINSQGEIIVDLLDQLEKLRAMQSKIIQILKDQGDVRKKIGALYKPDYGNSTYEPSDGMVNIKTGNEQFDALILKLRQQIQDLMRQIKKLEREIESLNYKLKQIPALNNTVLQLKMRIAELEGQMESYREEYERNLAELMKIISELREENDHLRLEAAENQQKLASYSDVDDLRA